MKLNVIVPTFNRDKSLRKTLSSLATARLPENFEVVVTVVDNNSTDDTAQVVEEMKPQFSKIKLEYLFEKKQGRSFALNSGINLADGDILSGIDDDEEIDANWFVEVEKIFRERWDEIDFVGGKLLPNWETAPPSWIEPLKDGVICWRDYGDEEWVYDRNTPIITGGHGIFRTDVFKEIGLYSEAVGAQGKGFISGEDEVLYDRLLDTGKRGVYNPKLIIYHYVPAYRLDKNYYRRWLFGVGMSRHLADTYYKPFDGANLFGVPRWMYRTALSGVFNKIKNIVEGNETESLAAENQPVIFAGYFYGRNLQNSRLDKFLEAFGNKFFNSAQR
jgi:glycosyltransferase involved in cell wall biosynthesis